ncbi:MAG: proline dehydrogenase family protein, partial [Sphaerotilus sulfidivorans]|uniref:proline dehydrogenase family protein n=1 Tax=Sphaerotilus sulfidivorans TaxID=639200 RepID=UPI003F3CD18B
MNALTDLPAPAALAATFSDRLPAPVRDESQQVARLLAELHGRLDWAAVIALGTPWVDAVRRHPAPFWAMESLLREYPISSAEGLALMRLAEALLRVPDTETALALTADQLGRADFAAHTHDGQDHALMSHLAAQAIELSKKMLPGDEATGQRAGLLQRLGAKTVVAATVRAIQLLGRQFVLGQNIGEALDRAAANHREHRLLRHSFDMLGEGARTDADAQRYAKSYADAIAAIAARGRPGRPEDGDGISIKLSAIDPRYEAAQFATVQRRMMPRLLALVDAAASANLNLTIDAEETERLELSLAVLDATAAHVAQRFPTWRGLGLAVQAYQTRAPEM